MELQINHPETCSYTVADVRINSHKSEGHDYLSVLIVPRDESKVISLSLGKKDWIRFVATTSRALMEIED